MDKHDFSYVLFSAALGALGVFLIAGLALEDRVLLIFSGLSRFGTYRLYCLCASSRLRSEI
jgi:hypothetical protein